MPSSSHCRAMLQLRMGRLNQRPLLGQAGDALFSQPVHLHLQLAVCSLLAAPARAWRAALEDARTGVEEVAFPLRDLHRMHAKLAGQLVERLLALDRLQRHRRLELATMTPAWRPRSPSNGSQWFSAHTSPSFPSCPLPPKCMSSSSYRGSITLCHSARTRGAGGARESSVLIRRLPVPSGARTRPQWRVVPRCPKGSPSTRACVRGGESRERGEPGRPTRSLVCHQGLAYSPGGARDRCRAPRPCDALPLSRYVARINKGDASSRQSG